MEQIATIGLNIAGIYLLLGIIFAIAFLWKGITKVDAGAKNTRFFLKLLIFPGAVLFWVVLLRKWIKSTKSKPA